VFLRDVFRQNGYSNRQIHRVLSRRRNITQPEDKPDSVAFLPYVRTIFNHISGVLSRHKTKSVGLPPNKLSSFLLPVNNNLALRTPGVYKIPCECGKVYTGQTGPSVDTRLKEHQRHICLEHPDKSAVPEHSADFEHRIQLHNTSILATKTRYMNRVIREAIEIELHPNNMNREVVFCLSKSLKPLICSLKIPPEHDARSTGLLKSRHGWQLRHEATGSMLSR
jgi:predicted GIY-YIG superfamily endonuclease